MALVGRDDAPRAVYAPHDMVDPYVRHPFKSYVYERGDIWRCNHCGGFWVLRTEPAEQGLFDPGDRWWSKIRWWNFKLRSRIIDLMADPKVEWPR